jgi:FAD/FMN-containing dehydrogenase
MTVQSITADLTLADLIATVNGPVLLPDDPGFAEEIFAWNVAVTHSPAIVVGATSAEDVAAAVRYAAAHGLPVAVQATGHGALRPADGIMLVTTRRLDEVRIDPDAARARVGAGVKWRRVIDAAAPYGLAPLNGSSSDVGVVGYTLGGGLGPIARKYGFAADHVLALELVTADGEIRTVTADEHPDLFWALRGGKGNFGIVTAIEFELLPITTLYGGGIIYPAATAPAVLHAFREWSRDLPDEVGTSIVLLRVPDVEGAPPPLRGKLVVHLRYAYVGDPAEGARLLEPMRAAAPSMMDYVGEMPYAQCDIIHQDPVDPSPAWERGVLLDELPAEAIDSILAIAGPDVEVPLIMVELRLMGGAIARQPAQPNAVAGRNSAYSLFVLGPKVPGLTEAVRAVGTAVIDAVEPYRSEGALVNFLGDQMAPEQVRTAYTLENRQWLLRIKEEYDPTNMFTFGHALTAR